MYYSRPCLRKARLLEEAEAESSESEDEAAPRMKRRARKSSGAMDVFERLARRAGEDSVARRERWGLTVASQLSRGGGSNGDRQFLNNNRSIRPI